MERVFRTEIKIPKSAASLGLNDKVLTIGSCFSDVIGSYLSGYKFKAVVNPFGTVYNPISIFNLLTEEEWNWSRLVEVNDLVFHYDAHSSFCAESNDELKEKLGDLKSQTINKLRSADWLIVTFGTSLVYRLKDTNEIVANCHKIPQSQFEKHALSVKDMLKAFEEFYEEIKVQNPGLKIILTVSPVRHIKDGLVDNAVSKSKLRISCDEIDQQYENVHYFPSYEIMMDDLRDYRFYKPDMIHPNEVAEEYIWQQFQNCYFDDATKKFVQEWGKMKSAISHRPFNVRSAGHQQFLAKTIKDLDRFKAMVDVREEERQLKDQLL
ncbi:MAG: GSCFA domain-containing protein [Cyclobacteriaceae bacterium]